MPAEVQAVYPHLGAVPRDVWLHLFGSAEQEIDVLAGDEDPVLEDPEVQGVLAEKARAGIAVRICLVSPGLFRGVGRQDRASADAVQNSARPALARALSDFGSSVEVRVRSGILYATIYHADDELAVSQHVYGTQDLQRPVLCLRRDAAGSLAATYLESFERFWADTEGSK